MATSNKAPFNLWSFFFSLKGRVSRWPVVALVIPAHVVFWGTPFIWGALMGSFKRSHPHDVLAISMAYQTIFLGSDVIWLALLWPLFALPFKRLHDANMSGAFALPYMLPIFAAFTTQFQYAISDIEKIGKPTLFFHGAYFTWGFRIIAWAVAIVPALLPGTKGANRFGPAPGESPASIEDVF